MSLHDWLRSVIPPLYPDAGRVIYDVERALQTFNALQPSIANFTYNDGRQAKLLSLKGTLPIGIRGQTYNIPVQLWISNNYPVSYPISYVAPTSNMAIKPNKHVDSNGTIYHAYLTDWANQSQRANLHEWLSIMQHLFVQECPVYSKSSLPSPPGAVSPSSSSNRSSQGLSPTQSVPQIKSPTTAGKSQGQPQPATYAPAPSVLGAVVSGQGPTPHVLSQSYNVPSSSQSPQRPLNFNQPAVSQTPDTRGAAPSIQPPPYSMASLGGFSSFHQSVNVTAGNQAFFQQNQRQQPANLVRSANGQTASLMDQQDDPALIYKTLDTALREKIARRFKSFNAETTNIVDQLLQDAKVLNGHDSGVADLQQRSAEQYKQLSESIEKVTAIKRDLDAWIEKLEQEPDIDLDTSLAPKTAVEAQLLDLVAEEAAIEDVMYHLGQALAKEKIELDVYLKHTRSQASEQFLKRALIKKVKGILSG